MNVHPHLTPHSEMVPSWINLPNEDIIIEEIPLTMMAYGKRCEIGYINEAVVTVYQSSEDWDVGEIRVRLDGGDDWISVSQDHPTATTEAGFIADAIFREINTSAFDKRVADAFDEARS